MLRCPLCASEEPLHVWHGPHAVASRCRRCGVVYLSWLSEQASAIARDTYETIYARASTLSDLTRQSYEMALRHFARYRQTGRLLDIGCGAGGFLAVAARARWKAVGAEIAAGAGELARREGATVLVGEDATSALRDASFDVVTLWEVIEHVEDPVALLREARRLLRPGGLLYVTTPNYASLQRRLLGGRWPRYHLEHRTYFDPHTLQRALVLAPLVPQAVYSKNFDPFLVAVTLMHRGDTGSADGAPADAGPPPAARVGRVSRGREALRWFLKRTPPGRTAAKLANRFLTATGLGDTLVAEAERRR